MRTLAIQAEPVRVVGRLTAEDIGATIAIGQGVQRMTGELREVQHKRELMSGVLVTRVWLKAPGWSSFIDLPPSTGFEVIR